MKDKIGIVIAMKEELEPFLKISKAFKTGIRSVEVHYANMGNGVYYLARSGIGRTNAALATALLANNGCSKIFNIGTCGCTYTEPVFGTDGTKFIPSAGEIWIPEHFYDGDFDLSVFGNNSKDPAELNKTFGPNSRKITAPRIFTVSKFATEPIAEGGYLVDMESYGCLAACSIYGVNFHAIKVISDSASENADKDFDGNVKNVMENSVQNIMDIISGFANVY